jgi:hypothetical protein
VSCVDGGVENQEGFVSTDEVILRLRQAIRAANNVVEPAVSQAVETLTPVTTPVVSAAPEAEQPVAVAVEDQPVATFAPTSDIQAVADADPAPLLPVKKLASKRTVMAAAIAFALATTMGTIGVWKGNRAYGPEMYGYDGMVPAAEASTKNLNYAVFDLNLNIRALREAQIQRMTRTPDVILLGASHWQEGDKSIAPGLDFFNSHIHRDYWEDLLGMVNLYVKYDRLPKKMIIAIRDNQFKPIEARTDFLWEPGIPSYREMTERLGIESQNMFKTLPYDRIKALVSLPMLFENLTRWHNAKERPHVSTEKQFDTLDTLLPDGSIVWSRKHMALFTQERALKETMAFVEKRRNDPPRVDQQGVDAFEKVLVFLKERGVEVTLVKPPFNPVYYDAVQEGTYKDGLTRIEELVQDIATRHGLKVIGSYNPHDIGCVKEMYIDAEHSNSQCLKKVLAPYVAEHTQKTAAK